MRILLSSLIFILTASFSLGQTLSKTINPFLFTNTRSIESFQGSLFLSTDSTRLYDVLSQSSFLYKLNENNLAVENRLLLNDLVDGGKTDQVLYTGDLRAMDSSLVLAVAYHDSTNLSTPFQSSLLFFDQNLNLQKEIVLKDSTESFYLITFQFNQDWIILGGMGDDSARGSFPKLVLINRNTKQIKHQNLQPYLDHQDAYWTFSPQVIGNEIYANVFNHNAVKGFKSNLILDTNLTKVSLGTIYEPQTGSLGTTLHRHGAFVETQSGVLQVGNSRSYFGSTVDPQRPDGYWNLAYSILDDSSNVTSIDTLPLSGYDIALSAQGNNQVVFNFDGIDWESVDSVLIADNTKNVSNANYRLKDTVSFYIYNLNMNTRTVNWSRKITRPLINGGQAVAALPNNRYAISFNQYDWVSNASPNLETVVWILDSAGNIINQREWSAPRRWSVYPNPVEHELRLSKSWRKDKTYQISDMQGRPISAGVLKAGERSIPLSELPVGQYIFSIAGGQQQIIKQ